MISSILHLTAKTNVLLIKKICLVTDFVFRSTNLCTIAKFGELLKRLI